MQFEQEAEALVNLVNKLVLQIENRIKGNSIKIMRKIIEIKLIFFKQRLCELRRR